MRGNPEGNLHQKTDVAVEDASGIGIIGSVVVVAYKGGISVSVAASEDLRIWSVTVGPAGGAQVTGSVGPIFYSDVLVPIEVLHNYFMN